MEIYKKVTDKKSGKDKLVQITSRESILEVASRMIAHYNLAEAGADDMILPSEITRAVADAMQDEILVVLLEKNLLK